MEIANQLGWSRYLDLGVTAAARNQLLEQVQWGRGDDDFSAVARKYLADTESPDYEQGQPQEQGEQASAEPIAPAPAAAVVPAEVSPPSFEAVAAVHSAGSGELKEAISWRGGFLTQLLRRGRQLLKQPVSSK
jgi:hypothetical protein